MASAPSLEDLLTPVDRASVKATLLGMLTTLDFPVEAWQEKAAARAFVELQSAVGAEQSKSVAAIAAGMHATNARGLFLDARLKSDFDEERGEATAAILSVELTNAGSSNYTKTTGQVSFRASNGRTFTNSEGFTLSSGATAPVAFTADLSGADGNITGTEESPQILPLTTPLAGVTARYKGELVQAGVDAETDPAYRERAITKWATLRVERIDDAVKNIARSAAPQVVSVSIDSENPRGPGTVNLYLAGQNAPSGSGDVDLVQDALDARFFGNGTEDQLVQAFAASAAPLNLDTVVYVKGKTEAAALTELSTAWTDFVEGIPVGGFDLSPGPTHIVLREQMAAALKIASWVDSVQINGDDLAVAPEGKVTVGTVAISVIRLATAN
jgi:uncharacterized phage protein gp47/JayE